METDPALEAQAEREKRNSRWYTDTERFRSLYEKAVQEGVERHSRMSVILNEVLPSDGWILFVDMVERGSAGSPYIPFIDQDRLRLAWRAQTGNDSLDATRFQNDTMRYWLGFSPNDPRFVLYQPLRDGDRIIDLTGCCGMVLSGSEAFVSHDESPEHQAMSNKVLTLVSEADARHIPLFGICFGSQILNHAFGATVEWINPREPEAAEVGLVRLEKTTAGKQHPLLAHIPDDSFYIHVAHRQHVDPAHIPNDLQVLASSETSQVHIAERRADHTILAIQGHPECTDAWVDISYDLMNVPDKTSPQLFAGYTGPVSEQLFTGFLNMCRR